MSKTCNHPESKMPEGKSIALICYTCGHVDYQPQETTSDDIVARLYDVPAGTLVSYELMDKMRDAVIKQFVLPDNIIEKLNRTAFPSRELFHWLMRKNCGVNDDTPV